ncbi:hypothetical protein Tco_0630761 [Tanacetum coccineum]
MDDSRPCERVPLDLDPHPSFLAIIGSSIFTVGSFWIPRVIPLRVIANEIALMMIFDADSLLANVVGNALSREERVKSGRVLLVGSVMDGDHASRYLVHPGANKTYYILGDMYWLSRVEKDITTYIDQVSSFSSCTRRFQDVKLSRIYIDDIIARNGILHRQADGQSERMIQTLEDIMRACVVNFGGSYQLSIWCAPFKALYGRKWRKPLEFEVGDRVLLKVTPWKGVVRFGKKGKLALRYVGPFKIIERISLVAYMLRLPKELNSVHDTFHVLNQKKFLADASLHVPLDEIKVDKTLRFVEEPVEIMDREN